MTIDEMIESVRAAVAEDATPEQRAVGAESCRLLLTALSVTPGEPFVAAPIDVSNIATAIGTLRGVPPEQLLDLAIAKLRSALPAGADVPPVKPLKFHIVTIPRR